MRLLLVDHDGVNRYTVSKALQRVGYIVAEADSGETALERYIKGDFDLILSEIGLPGINGIELLQAVKNHSPDAIVILMTNEVSIDDAIRALRGGASDLLVKPYSSEDIRESVERGIGSARSLRRRRRLLDTIERTVTELAREVSVDSADGDEGVPDGISSRRRVGTPPRGNVINLGPLAVLPGKYQIATDEKSISLTPTEFDLLLYLAANRSRVATCQELVREVRGYQTDETEAREVIRPHISNLRRKLRSLGEIDLIVNVRSVGYRLGEIPECD